MSGWDTSEAVNGGGGEWNDGGDVGAAGFTDSSNVNGGDFGFTNQDARGDVDGEAANDGKCHNCGGEGHMARDCEEPRKMGACFNCGEEGHSKVDCVKPRVFTGECNDCGEKGHQARDCPKKPTNCRNCLQEGHGALECKNPKAINDSDVPDKTEDEAWAMLTAASEDRDLDDFKDALKILHKAIPTSTYQELEKEFRVRKFNVFIIAMEKDIGDTWTNVSLQGEVGKKYAVGYYYNEKPQRPSLKDKWPASPEENMERLADAGTPLDRGVEKCGNCNEVGHLKRACPQELVTVDRPTVSCALCGEEGHRVRDCTQERQQPREPRACKVCEATDHLAKDCPNREKRTCRNCGSEDHMAKECDIKKCRNCDSLDHEARDCTAPKDWSRVKCRNCGEMGHTVKRCKEPIKEDENTGGDAGFGNSGFDAPAPADTGAASGGWKDADAGAGSGHKDWEKSTPTIAVGGGSSW